jgi:hypothetical protein
MFFAVPFMFLVPVGVICILSSVLEELLNPTRFWKVFCSTLVSWITAICVLSEMGYDKGQYSFGISLLLAAVIGATQPWRWLVPSALFFLGSLFALFIVEAILMSALGMSSGFKEVTDSVTGVTRTEAVGSNLWIMRATVWASGIASVVGTIRLNVVFYNKKNATPSEGHGLHNQQDVDGWAGNQEGCGARTGELTCTRVRFHSGDHIAHVYVGDPKLNIVRPATRWTG